ncbi:unnamed protein product [Callosobruchus maculatus]|uniref:Major facilitator superfamily (MFS) profile domain-containing protein n=1 Tax=Callosobruchus maculatus TaxID=64391 RepID=A0A653D6H8_CALMS|nr:unnamed protein product [Callosobruchus maculatus]
MAATAALMSVTGIVLAFANSVWLFSICRLFLGFGKGATVILIPLYVGEVAHKQNRGRFAFFLPMELAMGFVYSFATGPQFSTRVYTLLCTIPVLLAFILILVVIPETPYFLVAKDRPRNEVSEVLAKLRSCGDLEDEMKQIESAVVRKSRLAGQHRSTYLSLFRDRASRKAFMINSSMMIFNLSSGVVVIHSFLGPIMDRVTATKWSGNTSAITISLVKLCSTAIGSFMVERRGRKPLLIWSAVLAAFCHLLLGLYFQLQELEYEFVSLLSPVPFVCIVLFSIAYSFGLGPVPVAYMSEFFPQYAKNLGVPVCTAIGFLVSGLIAFAFPYFMEYLGMQWCFWHFGVICVTCAILTKYVVPDTDGKTLEEIQRMMEE